MATQPAQPTQPPISTRRQVILDSWMASVTVIEITSTGSATLPCGVGTATGFFYRNADNKYLITNRHVVINEGRHFYPDSLTIRIHTNRGDLSQNRDVAIPLYDADRRPLWLQHPRHANAVDVVAININSLVQTQDFLTFLSADNFLPQDMILNLGDAVLVLGYPLSFYDRAHNLPIAKAGTLASPFGVPFEERPHFLIDASLQEGTSGSPVLLPSGLARRVSGTTVTVAMEPSNHLLGIHSAEYSADGIGLGLHVVWYSELIQEIVSQEPPAAPPTQ
jgi:S1-C subfamily serine protease